MKEKIGFTCGAFDLMHAGHVLMFEECKTVCEYLIVGLQNNPSQDRPQKNAPVLSIVERQILLMSNKNIDDVIVYNTEKDLEDMLRVLPINVRIVGEDYANSMFTGKDICISRGIQIYYNARQHDFSTSSLRQRVVEASAKADKYSGTVSVRN